MAIPPLPDSDRLTEYTVAVADDGPFSIGFHIYADDDDPENWIEVWLSGEQQVGNWTLTSVAGGSDLSIIARPITDAQITFHDPITGALKIVGARRPRQASQFTNGQSITADQHNRRYTDLMATAREVYDLRERLIRSLPGESLDPLPAAASRAGKFAVFDTDGNLTFTAGTVSAVAALASLISNDSSVSGATVKAALETLKTSIAGVSGVLGNNTSPYDFAGTDTARLQAAIATGKSVDLRGGQFTITSGLTLGTGQRMFNGTLVKGGNIDMLTMGNESILSQVRFHGAGASFTGRGIVVPTATVSQIIVNCSVTDTVGYALEFEADGAGSSCIVQNGAFSRNTTTLEAIKLPTDTGTNGLRYFINVRGGGAAVFDLGGSNLTHINGGDSTTVTFSASTSKLTMKDHRTGTCDVRGTSHIISHCSFGNTLTIKSDAVGVSIGPNIHQGNSLVLESGATGVLHRNDEALTDNSARGVRIVHPLAGAPVHSGVVASAVDFNTSGDTALTVALPAGYTKFRIQALIIYSASASLSTSHFELRTASGGGGTAIITDTTCTITTASTDTSAGLQALNPSINATMADTTLFFRITTPQGSAATASVMVQIQPLP